jgi:O-antigen/teichoic acid export membrane protein
MLAAPLSLLSITFSSALQAKDDFTTPNQTLYGSPLLTLAGLIGLVATGKLTPLTAGLAYALPSIPSTLWLMLRLQTLFQIQLNHFLVSAKLLLDYGLRSYGVDILGTLSLQIGQVLVVGLLSPANMGLYTVALSLSRMLNLVQSSIVTVLLPKAANRPIAEICTLTSRVARISLAFTLGIAAIVAGIAPTLLHWLYGAEFLQAVTVLQILLLEVVLGSTVWILAQAFMAAGRPGIVTLLQGIGLGLTLPLMLMLIPRYGLVGAGLSLLGSTIIRLGFILVCFLWVLKVPIPSLLLAGEDITFLQKRLLKQR